MALPARDTRHDSRTVRIPLPAESWKSPQSYNL